MSLRPLLLLCLLVPSLSAARAVDELLEPSLAGDQITPLWQCRQGPSDAFADAAFQADLARALEDETEAPIYADDDVAPEPAEPPSKTPAVVEPFVPGKTCVSLGSPSSGFLIKGVPITDTPHLKARKYNQYGTPEMVEAIKAGAAKVASRYPLTPPLIIGDLSRQEGGPLPPHLSHQSGRDVDIGIYLIGQSPARLMAATPKTIDVARVWALIESFLEGDGVEYIFLDYSLQGPLYNHARDVVGLPPERLTRLFEYPRGMNAHAGIIRHSKGHQNHLHVRFRSPRAVAAQRAYLAHYGPVTVHPIPVYYTVKRGDTPAKVARKLGISLGDLGRWNQLPVGKEDNCKAEPKGKKGKRDKKKPEPKGKKGKRDKKGKEKPCKSAKAKKISLKPGTRLIVGHRRPKLPGND